MKLKKVVKKVIPRFLLFKLRNFKFKILCYKYFKYDAQRFTIYSSSLKKSNSPQKVIGQIIAGYHVIEKGLSMPNMKAGFGKKVLEDLIYKLDFYYNNFDKSNEQLNYALRVIKEYDFVHKKNKYRLDDNLQRSINEITALRIDLPPSKQIETTKHEYFKSSKSSFKEFSNSRHSVRNFTNPVDLTTIIDSIRIAQNAPSACNRQPSKVIIVDDKKLILEILSIQNGNRGFGHLCDKLLVLTSDLSVFFDLNERNDVYVNGGIYAMNLLYALHYSEIGACTLNWCASPEQDMKLRKLCKIPNNETVILIIACGGVPNNFKLVTSHRSNIDNVIRIL